MRIDSTHRAWMAATLIMLAFLAGTFTGYSALWPNGPRGSSLPGLVYGIAGYGLMLYAALLGMRKKVPVWRIGRAQTWMRGHLWLGFLSLPLILFHFAFVWKGLLASVIMLLLFRTVGTGLLGVVLQHYLPKFLTRSVPMETIYEEIPHVRRQLCDEADLLAASISATGPTEETLQTEIDPETRERFATIYAAAIRPALLPEAGGRREARFDSLAPVFDTLRTMLPANVHSVLIDLENICREERQLQRQRRIHFWLHAWLLVHVPLSIALLVLGAVHAVMALRY